MKDKFTVDFGAVTLSSLVLTNDKAHFQKMKARGNIGVLFEPSVVEGKIDSIYLIGILEDRVDPILSPKPD